MSIRSDFRKRIERLTAASRLAVLVAAGGLLLLGKASWVVWAAYGAVLILSAGSSFLTASDRVSRQKRAAISGWVRAIEIVAVAAASLSLTESIPFCWVLGSGLILTEAIASRSRVRVTCFAVLLGAAAVAGEWMHGNGAYAILALVTVLASSIVALGLAKFHVEEEAMAARAKRLSALLACGAGLTSEKDQTSILPKLLAAAVRESGASFGYILIGDEQGSLRVALTHGYSQVKMLDGTEITGGASVVAARTGEVINRVESSPDGQMHLGGAHAIVSVPLVAKISPDGGIESGEKLYGTLTVIDPNRSEEFEVADVDLLKTFASLISVSILNARMETRLRTAYVRSLEALVRTLEARDEYTRGHSERVCSVSMLLAAAHSLSAKEIEELRVGALLHDVGKIGVPDEVLNKPGGLTHDELAIMRAHPLVGYEICKPLGLNDSVLGLIRNHHEWLDGSGYPDALTGENIGLSLRILAVADAWDAMNSRRSYREILQPEEIFAQLESESGRHYDPKVLATLRELYVKGSLKRIYPEMTATAKTEAA